MKIWLKNSLFNLGLFPHLDLLRRAPAIIGWVLRGCSGRAPEPVKRMAIIEYARRCQLKRFIETGTHLGDTVANVARDRSIQITSIELDESYYGAAKRRFRDHPNVTLLHGDSGALLPGIVRVLTEPALFWLDGHYSGGNTGKGILETPVSAELDAILTSPIAGHVILIDDARLFDGTHDYPHLDELIETIRVTGRYQVEVSGDIIRATPKLAAF